MLAALATLLQLAYANRDTKRVRCSKSFRVCVCFANETNQESVISVIYFRRVV
jgi:hypothetical protein